MKRASMRQLTLIFKQSDHTPGFQLMKSALEKVPNMAAMELQVSDTVIGYHAMKLLAMPVWTSDGAVVTVGGMGRLPGAKSAT
jgi:uncharacterized protein YwlG (UPF0340 family)